jgi:hypothetical protein
LVKLKRLGTDADLLSLLRSAPPMEER